MIRASIVDIERTQLSEALEKDIQTAVYTRSSDKPPTSKELGESFFYPEVTARASTTTPSSPPPPLAPLPSSAAPLPAARCPVSYLLPCALYPILCPVPSSSSISASSSVVCADYCDHCVMSQICVNWNGGEQEDQKLFRLRVLSKHIVCRVF